MKNPFLEDRNIFSKVPKPISKIVKDDKETDNLADKKPSYEPKYNVKPETRSINPLPNNNPYSNTYQRQPSANYPSTQPNPSANNRYMSSEKITFGDPISSEAYTGDRTSGYFNMLNSQQLNSTKPIPLTKQDNLKYQLRKNIFFQSQFYNVKQRFQADIHMKQTIKQFGKSLRDHNHRTEKTRIEYEFTPPPINNFTTTPPIQQNYKFQTQKFGYKSSFGNNHQRPSYQSSFQDPYIQPSFKNDSNLMHKNSSNTYKSPPKYQDNPFTPKSDLSQRFKQNNFTEYSPIGQVSRHKINEDSIMNLDGLMDGIELDKLLAESKTQEELLKILGMDASMIKKNPDSGNRNKFEYQQKLNTFQTKQDTKTYSSTYENQYQNNFSKKPHQPDTMNEVSKLKGFRQEQDEPQVFNYGETKLQNFIRQTNQIRSQHSYHRQSPPKFNKPSGNTFRQPETNFYNEFDNPYQKPGKQTNHHQHQSQEQEYDLEKIMQRQMENFMIQQEGSGKDKRVFMTANQKIVTKKYKLQAL